jgi:hypothetical protein
MTKHTFDEYGYCFECDAVEIVTVLITLPQHRVEEVEKKAKLWIEHSHTPEECDDA